jgi:hypothetical protein
VKKFAAAAKTLQELLSAIPEELVGLCDRTSMLIVFVGALRCSELAAFSSRILSLPARYA